MNLWQHTLSEVCDACIRLFHTSQKLWRVGMQYFDILCWKNDLNSFFNVVIFSVQTIWSPFYLEIEGLFIFSFQGRGLLMKNNTTHLQVASPFFFSWAYIVTVNSAIQSSISQFYFIYKNVCTFCWLLLPNVQLLSWERRSVEQWVSVTKIVGFGYPELLWNEPANSSEWLVSIFF